MDYKIEFTDIALKNLKKLSQKDKKLILGKIELLSSTKHKYLNNVKKLVNFSPSYRLRIGQYRVLFERYHSKKLIAIIDVLHRSKAYKKRRTS